MSVCFHLLLNLAEDVLIERKMKKRHIVLDLVTMLDWENKELLVVVLTFLKKLSIFKENKNEMQSSGAVTKIAKFIPNDNEVPSFFFDEFHVMRSINDNTIFRQY